VPGAEHVIVGDLSDSEETKNVAYEANAWGRFDAVIHNAGVYQAPRRSAILRIAGRRCSASRITRMMRA
jgi:NADP-dependent 3-hydroxy acid dehydrogenase YdfG